MEINDLLLKKEILLNIMSSSNTVNPEEYALKAIDVQNAIYDISGSEKDKFKSIEIMDHLLKILGYPREHKFYSLIGNWFLLFISEYKIEEVKVDNEKWRSLEKIEILKIGFLRNVLAFMKRSPKLVEHLPSPTIAKIEEWRSIEDLLLR